MSNPQKRLGRGLSSLISLAEPQPDAVELDPRVTPPPRRPTRADADSPTAAPAAQPTDHKGLLSIPLNLIEPNPYQPRTDIDKSEIDDLAGSIRQSGIIQPLVVRRKGSRWELISGERRLRAAGAAGLAEVPAVVREATNEEMLEWALIENIHREDLNAIDRARAYARYMNEFRLSIDEVADRVSESRPNVANYLRLLDLDAGTQELVAGGGLSMGHARCLLGLATAAERLEMARAVIENQLSVRALEDIVKRRRERAERGGGAGTIPKRRVRPQVRALEKQFEAGLGTRVQIKEGRRANSGRIVIQYYTLDDFQRIAERLGVDAAELLA